MLLSKASEYGIRAVLYLASLQEPGYVAIRSISEALGISSPFLTKILQQLNQADLLTSYRGPNGGVALARPAAKITLEDVYVAIEGPALFTECVLGLPGCGDQKPCPLHRAWAVERERLRTLFAQTTLADFGEALRSGDLRLQSLVTQRLAL